MSCCCLLLVACCNKMLHYDAQLEAVCGKLRAVQKSCCILIMLVLLTLCPVYANSVHRPRPALANTCNESFKGLKSG